MRALLSIIAVLALGLGSCGAEPASGGKTKEGSAASAANAAPDRTVEGFYAAYRALPAGGGVPDEDARATLSPFISPALNKLLADADAAETAYAKATNGESPPLIEGDPFSSLFEGATGYEVGKCEGDAKAQQCVVDLVYDDKSAKPTKWQDTADVVMTGKGWRVDDIEFGGTWDFANKGRLTELLKAAIDESKKPVE
ncbi:MAG: hypothetical protein WAW96_09110 [Alphaproteobacteria bacterium]